MVRPLFEENLTMRSLSERCQPIQRVRSGWLVAAVTIVATLAGGISSARAGYDVSGASSGVAVFSNLSIPLLANANVSVNSLSGTAPTPYNSTLSLPAGATISSGGFLTGTLLTGNTGLLTTTISSSVDGFSVNGSANGTTLINNLGLNVLDTLVSINATTLMSSSTVSGSYGSLTPVGATSTSGLDVKVLGIDVTSLLMASSGSIVNINGFDGLAVAGLSIGLNVMTTTGNGTTTSGITTDNLIVQFNGLSYLGLSIGGTLDIGQSQASMVSSAGAVPEPSSIALTALGLLSLGAFGIRQKHKRRLMQLA
jgi:hypothetical protein